MDIKLEFIYEPEYLNKVLDELLKDSSIMINKRYETAHVYEAVMKIDNVEYLKKFMKTDVFKYIFQDLSYLIDIMNCIQRKEYDKVDLFFKHKKFRDALKSIQSSEYFKTIINPYIRQRKLNKIFN